MTDDRSAQLAWRSEMMDDLASGDLSRSTLALLSLTYDDPDRLWVEDLLLGQLSEGNDRQLRSLAVTCMGHLGRTRGVVSVRIVSCLEGLLSDSYLGGIAEDALGDVRYFATIV